MEKKKKGRVEVRHLTKIAGGSSYALVIPMDFVKRLGWKERQKLVIRLYGKKLVISDWEPKEK